MKIIRKLSKILPYSVKRKIITILGEKPLFKQLPLSIPLVMHIDPCNICNFKCVFCPTGDNSLLENVQRPKNIMDIGLFRKIVNDLIDMKNKCHTSPFQIHLYKDGEPLINKHLPEMIREIKDANVAHTIATTTNGSLLNKEYAEKLVEAGLDILRISVEATDTAGYRTISLTDTTYEQIIENVSYIYKLKKRKKANLHIIAKITDTNLNKEQIRKFKSDFGKIADETRVDSLMGWSYSEKKDFTLGTNARTSMDGKTVLHEQIVCPEPFSKCAVNSDGTVSVCCVDWSHGTVVGDTKTESISEIWNGSAMAGFRRLHLEGKKEKIAPCAQCQYMKGFPGSCSLDKYRYELLKRM